MNEFCSSAASAVIRNVFYATFIFFFGVVGSTFGGMTGALIGLKTKSSFFKGAAAAAVGALCGAIFSNEITKAFIVFWHSEDGELGFLLHLIEIFTRLLDGKLLQETFSPVIRPSLVLSQVNDQGVTVETNVEDQRFFHTRDSNVSSRGSVDEIPKIRITAGNIYDASGNCITCSVCLQDFQVGDVAGSLRHCHHMFHPPCIGEWLSRHSSCPLCRRIIL